MTNVVRVILTVPTKLSVQLQLQATMLSSRLHASINSHHVSSNSQLPFSSSINHVQILESWKWPMTTEDRTSQTSVCCIGVRLSVTRAVLMQLAAIVVDAIPTVTLWTLHDQVTHTQTAICHAWQLTLIQLIQSKLEIEKWCHRRWNLTTGDCSQPHPVTLNPPKTYVDVDLWSRRANSSDTFLQSTWLLTRKQHSAEINANSPIRRRSQ